MNHFAVHIGEPPVHAGRAEGELRVVDAHQVQDRGMKIITPGDAGGGLVAQIIRRTVDGEIEAFEQLVLHYQVRLLRMIATLLNDERRLAEDLAQIVFVEACPCV